MCVPLPTRRSFITKVNEKKRLKKSLQHDMKMDGWKNDKVQIIKI